MHRLADESTSVPVVIFLCNLLFMYSGTDNEKGKQKLSVRVIATAILCRLVRWYRETREKNIYMEKEGNAKRIGQADEQPLCSSRRARCFREKPDHFLNENRCLVEKRATFTDIIFLSLAAATTAPCELHVTILSTEHLRQNETTLSRYSLFRENSSFHPSRTRLDGTRFHNFVT